MGTVLRKMRNYGMTLAVVGAISGGFYNSIDRSYENLLKKEVEGYEITIKHMEGVSKKSATREEKENYNKAIKNFRIGFDDAKKRLQDYRGLPSHERKLVAAKDLGRYGGVLKNIGETGIYLPSTEEAKNMGKGATYGAGAGVFLGFIAGIKKKRREKKYEQLRKDLEREKGRPENSRKK